MEEQLKSRLLDSMAANRLVIFTGAGLSMAAPSEVPSAPTLAQNCATAYETNFGETLPPDCHTDIEKLAEYFAARGQLENVFLGTVIEQAGLGPFMRRPNKGHQALADMLGCAAIEANISTNVDTLIEIAAENLGEPLARVAVTREEAVTGSQPHRPHVKLHGCFRRNVRETLWCAEQLRRPPFDDRIRDISQWLPNIFLGKDLVFVGFWTDWAYLNNVLESIIDHSTPSLMVLVNPSDFAVLQQKAQVLTSFSARPNIEFVHVQESGADFLDELREGMGRRFMKVLLNRSAAAYERLTGAAPTNAQTFSELDSQSLYQWRRDSTCTPRENIVRQKWPDDEMERLGVAHHKIQGLGATIDNDTYLFRGKRIRLVQGAGRYLANVQKAFSRSAALSIEEDIIVCVGADDTTPLPLDITKGAEKVSVVNRGGGGHWLTETTMLDVLTALPVDGQRPVEEI